MAIQLTIMSIDFDSFEEPVTKTFHKSEVTLGSDDANDIVLDRTEISRSHAKILCKVNGNGNTPSLYITDLGSTNGTLVERDSIRPGVEIPLKNHQRVVIGSYLIKPIFVPDSEKAEDESHGSVEESIEAAPFEPVAPVAEEPAAGSIAALAAQKKPVEPAPVEIPPVTVAPAAPVTPAAPEPEPKPSIFEKEKEIVREAERSAVREEPTPPVRAAKPTQESSQHKQELERLEKTSNAKPVLHVPSAIRIRLDGKNVEGVKIVAKKLVTFHGVIHCSGGAVPAVKINAGKYGETTSAADGTFQIKGIVEGEQITIHFVQEGYRIRDYHGAVVGDVPITIEAVKLYNLRGRVVHKNVGLSGVMVDAGPVGKTLSSPDGSFEFRNIVAGTEYAFNVSKDRFQIDGASLKGRVTQELDLKFSARELFAISGYVIHNGTPLAGVEVECINFGKTVTDSAGKYVFENVPEGEEYAIVAHKDGFAFDSE